MPWSKILDALKLGYTFRSQDYRTPAFEFTLYQCPYWVNPQTPAYKGNIKDKGIESTTKRKRIEMDFFKISPTIKCYKYQGYGHFAANCPSLVKVAINKKLPDSEEFIYHTEESED